MVAKYLTAFIASIFSMLIDIRWMLVLVSMAVLWDCWEAYKLSRRVAKAYPDKAKFNAGKFSTEKAYKKIFKMGAFYLVILFAHLLDKKVMVMWDGIYLANWVTMILCILELFSIFENASSCKGSKFALVLQKILVDKTQRHLDIDLNALNDDKP
jgi:hypothetical protein